MTTHTINGTGRPIAQAVSHAADWRRRPESLTTSWEDRSACFNRPMEWWDGDNPALTAKAHKTCLSCPVLDECLRARMAEEGQTMWNRDGVRAGLTGEQRTQLFVDERIDGPYDAEEARLLALEAQAVGQSVANVAEPGLGESTMRLAARLAGEDVPVRKPPTAACLRSGTAKERAFARAEDIHRWRDEGASLKEIAARLGIGRTAVDDVLASYRRMLADGDAPEEEPEDPGNDLELWVTGSDVWLPREQKVEAIALAVGKGMSYLDIDRERNLKEGTTASYVSRQRRQYEREGKEFPLKAPARCTFTAEQIVEIRELFAAGGVTAPQLAMKYGIPRNTMNHILSGRNYRNAGGPLRAPGKTLEAKRASRTHFCGHTELDAPADAVRAS
jgi:DNA-binding NarL/FixJ family response regulator